MKILAYTGLHPGHLFPMVPPALELRSRGHDVVIGAESFGVGPADVGGVPIRQVRTAASRPPHELTDGAVSRLPIPSQDVWDFALIGQPSAVNLEHLIAELEPDALLVDATYWGAMIAAESSSLPWAALANNPLSFRGEGPDLRGPGRPPPHSWLGALWYRVLCASVRAIDDKRLPFINEVREARRLAPLRHACDLSFCPPVLLANTAEPFEYPRSDWPASLRFVGPLIWDPPTEIPTWIHTLDDRPLILVVGSTIKGRPDHAQSWAGAIFEALANEEVQIVATLPVDQYSGTPPSNVRVEPFVAHAPLIARASCVICHGGWGITQRALMAGVPVIAIPVGYDRFEVSRRLEVAKAGCVMSVGQLSGDRVRSVLRQALSRKVGAEHIAARFAQTTGQVGVANALEELLRTSRQTAIRN